MFRRRTPLSYLAATREALWPRKGWTRPLAYIKHRAARLPDPPERIARGVMAGVLVSFTPLFGLHFLLAALLAKVMRGNILASLAGTFIANPLTFPFIVLVSLWTGKRLLGREMEEGVARDFFRRLSDAFEDLWHNATAPFRAGETVHWTGLARFWDELFVPYAIGGLIPGVICGLAAYYLTLPAVTAWQKGREARMQRRLERKLERMRKRAEKAAASPRRAAAKGEKT